MRPISCERDRRMPGTSSARISAARCSISAVTGENTELIAAAVIFFRRRSRWPRRAGRARRAARSRARRIRCRRAACSDGGRRRRRDRPANRSTAAATGSPADRGGSRRLRTSRRRSTMALVKCVVPIITAWMSAAATLVSASRSRSTVMMPVADVRRRRRLAPAEHVEPVHQNGVGVRASDVDADAHCHKAPAFERPSDLASREASQNLLRLLSIRSAGELASRANGASHGGLPHF